MSSPDLEITTTEKDLEQFASIQLEAFRLEVKGANQFGRPTVTEKDKQVFTDPSEAIRWALESPQHMHSFEIPLPGLQLEARLDRDNSDPVNEMLKISSHERSGQAPRSIDMHHAVSTDYINFLDLIVYLDTDQKNLFDRGVIWVELGNSPAKLTFNINPGSYNEGEIKDEISQMLTRVKVVLNDLLNGMQFNSLESSSPKQLH